MPCGRPRGASQAHCHAMWCHGGRYCPRHGAGVPRLLRDWRSRSSWRWIVNCTWQVVTDPCGEVQPSQPADADAERAAGWRWRLAQNDVSE